MPMRLNTKVFAVLLILLMRFLPVEGCSLALHDWKLVFYLKIPVAAPLLPLAEMNQVSSRMQQNPVSGVTWVADLDVYSRLALGLFAFLADPAAALPWEVIPAGESMLAMARDAGDKISGRVLLSTDRCFLKIALFSDRNSLFNCHQLVVMQTGRIRAVQPDPARPWAQETAGQSWLSLIFYQIPVPGRIMSLSVYPVNQTRLSLNEDHPLVETLLSHRLLLRRPDLVVDPYKFDFPELPE